MNRTARSLHGDRLDPLDALAAAADALYTSSDDLSALDALRRADEALVRIPRARERAPELAAAASDVARARALVADGFVAEVRPAANRLYESALVMLEPVRPAATTLLMLLRLLLRRALSASGETGAHGPERLVLFARAASRALALETEGAASPLPAELEQVLARADEAGAAHDREGLFDGAQRALWMVDALEADLASPEPAESDGAPSAAAAR
jgi:hypothetical protein